MMAIIISLKISFSMHSNHTRKYEGKFQEDSFKRKYHNAKICLDCDLPWEITFPFIIPLMTSVRL